MNQQTEIDFTLPRGYIDAGGVWHRHGRMRLATALDEVEAVAHPKVQANEAYLPIVLLSRVLVSLGSLPTVTTEVVEGLFAADLAYLEDLYVQLNSYEGLVVEAQCPHCHSELHLRVLPEAGEA
ncbi:MAG: phage tail assembly protein [Anaerolineae bacterium]|nr:phage tail assembly protein [Anaerolineae bacterium]